MSGGLDDYTLKELLDAVKRKREKGEKLTRGRPEAPQPCKWCGIPMNWRTREHHEPRCEKNPLVGIETKGFHRPVKSSQLKRIRKTATRMLGKQIEVTYDNEKDRFIVVDPKTGQKWIVSGSSTNFELV